jgi:hypothetical protein
MAPFSLVSVVLLSLCMVASRAIGDQACAEDYCDDTEALLQTKFEQTLSSTPTTGNSVSCTDYTEQKREETGDGAVDNDGDGCSWYRENVQDCGKHDNKDFIAKEMCCSCGGGSTSFVSRSLAVNNASVFISESSDCPSGFEPITTLTACRAALDMVGLTGFAYNGAASESGWPKGCYQCTKETEGCTKGVWFNTHSDGQTVEGTQRFCQKGYDPASVKVLFVGDSDIDYWDSAVAFPGSFNVGVGGYTTVDVLKEVDQLVADLDPKWVVLVCGENDIVQGKRKKTKGALQRFKEIVGKLINDGARVIYLGTKPEPDSGGLFDEYKHFDAEIRKFASTLAEDKATPPFQMIDVFPSFTKNLELYNSDELHMSRLGYAFWNGWVKLAMSQSSPSLCIRWRDGVCVQFPNKKYD